MLPARSETLERRRIVSRLVSALDEVKALTKDLKAALDDREKEPLMAAAAFAYGIDNALWHQKKTGSG